jgi:hypothetical protein
MCSGFRGRPQKVTKGGRDQFDIHPSPFCSIHQIEGVLAVPRASWQRRRIKPNKIK